MVSIARYEEGIEAPGAAEMEGKVLTAVFNLDGQRFMALDGGPIFKSQPCPRPNKMKKMVIAEVERAYEEG